MSKNKCSQGKPYYGEACRSHDSKGRVTCRACCARMIPGTPLACVCYYTAQNMFIRSFRCLLHVIFQEDLPRVSAIHSSIFLGSTYVPGSQKPIPACSPCGLSLNNIWGCVWLPALLASSGKHMRLYHAYYLQMLQQRIDPTIGRFIGYYIMEISCTHNFICTHRYCICIYSAIVSRCRDTQTIGVQAQVGVGR